MHCCNMLLTFGNGIEGSRGLLGLSGSQPHTSPENTAAFSLGINLRLFTVILSQPTAVVGQPMAVGLDAVSTKKAPFPQTS